MVLVDSIFFVILILNYILLFPLSIYIQKGIYLIGLINFSLSLGRKTSAADILRECHGHPLHFVGQYRIVKSLMKISKLDRRTREGARIIFKSRPAARPFEFAGLTSSSKQFMARCRHANFRRTSASICGEHSSSLLISIRIRATIARM